MFLTLEVDSMTMELGANIPGNPPPYYPGYAFTFALQMMGFDRLLLETGEYLEDATFAKSRGTTEKQIKSSLILREALDDTQFPSNQMRYIEQAAEYDDPSSVEFHIFLPNKYFREIVHNVRSNLIPKTISVRLHYDIADEMSPIRIQSQESGTEIVWRNRDPQNRQVKVHGVLLEYELRSSSG